MSATVDPHTLVGVYAVNALSDTERAEFEAHLHGCPSCAEEVAELQATAAVLGTVAEIAPPAHLRTRVLTDATALRQLPPQASVHVEPMAALPTRNRWLVRASVLAAAASVLVAVVVGVQGVQDRRELDTLRQSAAGYSQVPDLLSAPDAKVLSEPGAGGGKATVVISPSRSKAVFLASGLPSLSADRDYQLWVVGTGDPRPAGLLRGEPVVVGGLADARAFALTVEPSGGSPAPTTEPVLAIAVA
ncbi:anti-sigma factor [Lentzea flaviverrucosa]|uniref:Regulator of SigK n=1 Tax=Lentzea flaviverrucosa TaxID=200379 RepID=A0A1H9XSE0_9PSEU|nr:anti-sigma factor [Lentzea flaviverrucosa]RDI19314.1 anti-sigma-K factor RskA [Lentzea flaviverrucosa]SES49072.1 Anti-sigma-K factor RskA [Lentzea flaviverrucosa]